MNFADKFTTQEKITADKDEIEIKKMLITNDAYAVGEMLQNLINKIEHTRCSLIK